MPVRRRQPLDEKTRRRADQRQTEEHHPDVILLVLVVEVVRQEPAADRAENDGQERQRLQQAVAARQVLRLQNLRHRPVLGRNEERGVHPHQEDARQDDPRPGGVAVRAHPEAKRGDGHDADLDELPEDECAAFAEAVGEVAGERHEQRPGGVEENRHQGDGLGRGQSLAVDGEEHRRRMDRLVVEGREELGDQ